MQETLRHIRQIGQQTRLRVTQGVKPQFPQLRRRIVNAGITHQHGHVLDGTLAFRVQRPQVAKRLDLVWQRPSRFVLVNGVVVTIAVEGRVQVDQVYTTEAHVFLHHGQAVAVVEPVHAKHPRKKARKALSFLRRLYFQHASAKYSSV